MDDRPNDGPSGRELQTVTVELTPEEAGELLEALFARADEDRPDPGWHLHITDAEGRELTIAVSGDARFTNRLAPPDQ
jgi:hypothetical protein